MSGYSTPVFPAASSFPRGGGEALYPARRFCRSQRGLSVSTSFVVIIPVLLLLIFGVIEAGIWWHGRRVAEQSANAAADIARSRHGNEAQARRAARHVAAVGGLENPDVSTHRGETRVTATTKARVPMPVDLGWGSITETATAPRERITQP